VTHNNVVRIHDLGEINGIKYITMSYVDGRDLATILHTEKRLTVPRALQIVRGVVAGLRAAHEAGVVHRDLKPANIMIDAHDEARIMDFGIARSTSHATVDETGEADPTGRLAELRRQAAVLSNQTMDGTVVGTVEYMAPEQARGEPVDQRADIYALGLIFYDMLGGLGRASRSTSAIDELTARMQHPPPSLRTINEDVPEALEKVMARCLEPHRDARYATTKDLEAALQRLDDEGNLLPVLRRVTSRQLAAAAVLVLSLLGGTWWLSRTPPPEVQPPPTSVLIADFDNQTGDPVFHGSLEQALGIGVEGASFITAYPRDAAQRLAAAQVRPGAKLDESVARLIAGREGIKVILSGSIEPKGSGYAITVRAVDPANGKTLATATASSPDKAGMLKAVGSVASRMRSALGDTTPESAKRAAIETFTAGSLEAAQDFSSGQELASSGKDEEAIAYYKRALEKDPRFGRAYTSWAVSAFKLGRRDESADAYKKAMALTDRMTDREKYRTFGVYYLQVARNYPKALENYTALVQAYPNDRAGHSNLALAHFYLRNFPKALEEGRLAVEQYPNLQTFRNNYALYAMYAGDFGAAAKEARRTLQENPTFAKAYLEVAIAALAAGDIAAANEAYDKMAQVGRSGASLAATGKADIALYTGRSVDARQILEANIPADKSAGNVYGVAAKYVALAEAYATEGNAKRSLEAAQQALGVSRDVNVAAAAARVMVAAGRIPEAKAIVDRLGQELEAEPRAYAKVIEGEIALQQRRTADAVTAFIESQKILDLWLARLDLGHAYEEAGHHAEALAELDRARKRRGEATALFLDDIPTFRHLATLPYWLARAQEGLGQTQAAAASFKAFLAPRPDAKDPLSADARRRLGRL
jgi:tetratricopeptide (TPR) repeat protein